MRTQKMIDRAARDEERQRMLGDHKWPPVLGREEWCQRYVEHLLNGHAGIERDEAQRMASSEWRHEEGKRVHRHGQYQNEPEAAAEIELMFWED